MATERAIVKGLLLNLVNTRSMFTADVVPSGGDTQALLWDTYLDSIYVALLPVLTPAFVTTTVELQSRTSSQWVTYDENALSHTGTSTGNQMPNSVAGVLIGKATGLHGLGRKFITGLAEQWVDGNTIAAVAMGSFAAALLAYLTPFTGLGGGVITPGILDKHNAFRPFVGGYLSSFVGSVRRRKPGNGM